MKKTKLSKGKTKFIINILMFPLFLLTFLMPKNRKLFILGSSRGIDLNDNTKYMYYYLKELKNTEGLAEQFYFITKSRTNYEKRVRNGEKNILYLYSLKGLIKLVRSKHVILTHSLDDLVPFLLGGKIIHQLWHGTPLKKIGYDADNWGNSKIKDKLKKVLYFVLPYTNYMYCHRLYISSGKNKKIFASAFNIKEKNIISLGQPRNDFLIKEARKQQKSLNKVKIISWLPTHRGFSGETALDLLEKYNFKKYEFNEFFKANNIIFYIKPHFVENTVLEEYLKDYSNIKIWEDVDPYPLLLKTDILITDYSSVLFDFLNLNRPAIFAPFDFEFYTTEIAELYFNYNDIAYGPICENWNEIINVINIVNDNKFAHKREYLRETHCLNDLNSSENILSYISSLK